jgi:hypothetical protein
MREILLETDIGVSRWRRIMKQLIGAENPAVTQDAVFGQFP